VIERIQEYDQLGAILGDIRINQGVQGNHCYEGLLRSNDLEGP